MSQTFEQLISNQNLDSKSKDFFNAVTQEKMPLQKNIENTEVLTTVPTNKPSVKSVDDFGQVVPPKGSSPFETQQSKKTVLRKGQNSIQGYLVEVQRDKALRKALALYSAFKKHCAQNKIDPNMFINKK